MQLSAEAASPAEAVKAVQEMIAVRLEHGAILVDHPVHPPRPPIMTVSARVQFESLVRAKLNVKHNDPRIAAIAKEIGATVVTRNRRDFGRVPGLVIEEWAT